MRTISAVILFDQFSFTTNEKEHNPKILYFLSWLAIRQRKNCSRAEDYRFFEIVGFFLNVIQQFFATAEILCLKLV